MAADDGARACVQFLARNSDSDCLIIIYFILIVYFFRRICQRFVHVAVQITTIK